MLKEIIPTYPFVELSIRSLKDFRNKELAKQLFELLVKFGKDYLPTNYGDSDPLRKRINGNDYSRVIDFWLNYENCEKCLNMGFESLSGGVIMKKTSGYKCNYYVSWKKDNIVNFNYFSMNMSLDYFKNEKGEEIFLNNCKEIIELLDPVHAQIINLSIPETIAAVDLKVILPELQWMVIFGPPYIEMFGREHLLQTPCYKVEEIGDRYIALQLQENLFEPVSDEIRQRVKQHLGVDAFVEKGRDYRDYRSITNQVPVFDFTNVMFDPSKPIKEQKILTREKG